MEVIVLDIERAGSRYFASSYELNVCGYGATPLEAACEAMKHIAYFREYYRNLPEDKAIGEATRLKQAFK